MTHPLDRQESLFSGLEKVTVDRLITELDVLVALIGESQAVRQDYERFIARNALADSSALYLDYVRVKIAFEATRGGGLWRLQWDITDEEPQSTRIWKTWSRAAAPSPVPAPDQPGPVTPTAIAECDELSALFAYVVRKLGVADVGLFWPTSNHTVAVWTIHRVPKKKKGAKYAKGERPVRVVVPTSKIFLEPNESLDTRGFDPWIQKNIHEYRQRDVRGTFEIPVELARFFVEQVRRHAHKSQVQLQRERNLRDRRFVAE